MTISQNLSKTLLLELFFMCEDTRTCIYVYLCIYLHALVSLSLCVCNDVLRLSACVCPLQGCQVGEERGKDAEKGNAPSLCKPTKEKRLDAREAWKMVVKSGALPDRDPQAGTYFSDISPFHCFGIFFTCVRSCADEHCSFFSCLSLSFCLTGWSLHYSILPLPCACVCVCGRA